MRWWSHQERLRYFGFLHAVIWAVVVIAPAHAASDCGFDDKNSEFVVEPPEPPTKGFRRTLTSVSILFEIDSWRLRSGEKDLVEKLAREFAARPDVYYVVWGYTDTVGSADDNRRLAFCRAAEVAEELTRRGAAKARIRIWGAGETPLFLPVPTGDEVREPRNNAATIEVQ